MRRKPRKAQVLGVCLAMLTAAILIQVFAASTFAQMGGMGAGAGPGAGAGAGPCLEPCWHPVDLGGPVTDLALMRKGCCLADRVAALVNGVGIFRSLDGGKTYTSARSLGGNPPPITYNLAPLQCTGACNDSSGDANKGRIYAATSEGLYLSDVNDTLNPANDLAAWTKVPSPKGQGTLPVTWVGSVVRPDGTEDVFLTADPGNATYGGLYKRNGSGGWDKVAPILNVVAIAPDCGTGARTFAATKPCAGCASCGLWISSGNRGALGTWSALPNGMVSGPKTTGYNDIATQCYGSPGTIFMTNADATLPQGQAVHRAPVTLATWDDVTFHDTTGVGGLIDRNRAGNIRWQRGLGGTFPGTTLPEDQLRVGALGMTLDGTTSGLYFGPSLSINWVPWNSAANQPLGVHKWINPSDSTSFLIVTVTDNGVGGPGSIVWHYGGD